MGVHSRRKKQTKKKATAAAAAKNTDWFCLFAGILPEHRENTDVPTPPAVVTVVDLEESDSDEDS